MSSILFRGGVIRPGGPLWEPVEAALVRDGRIVATGEEDELRASAPMDVEIFELDGRCLLPGFVDAHTHFLTGGRKLSCVQLRDASTPEEVVKRLQEFARTLAPGEWIIGGDWDHELWGGELPTRDWIDDVLPDHPLWIHRTDIHMTWSNSRALEIAGIDHATPDPAGGTIVRDAEGRATGILKDTAMDLVGRFLPASTDADREAWLRAAITHAHQNGLTQIHDVDGWDSLHTYRRVHGRDPLELRVYAAVPMSTWESLAGYCQSHGRGDEHLWWGGLKAFVDGSLGSSTAWFNQPYADDPDNRGLVVCDLDELRTQMTGADTLGFQAIIHAIGDRAVDWLLDTFTSVQKTNGPRDRRMRIEHLQHINPDSLDRLAALDLIASVQPAHLLDDGRWANARVGPERVRWTYAFASVAGAGTQLAFGSDWTVTALDPIEAIAAAVTRHIPGSHDSSGWIPEERLSLEAALTGHTLGAARAGFSDGFSGSLEIGKHADAVVLDRDPFAVDPMELSSLSVEYTFVGGKLVYSREGSA